MNRRAAIICLAAATLGPGPTRARAAWHGEVSVTPDSGINIEVSSPFDHAPPTGTLPVWVTIRNVSGAARAWSLVTDGETGYGRNDKHSAAESLHVENGQTTRTLILMPLDPTVRGYYYSGHTLRIEGYGVDNGIVSLPVVNAHSKGTPTPSVGIGEDLATPIWAGLTKWYLDQGKDLLGSPVDLELLNGDWRTLAGLDVLWLSDASYARLDAARRTAIRDWVSHGGLLCLCARTDDPSLRASVGLPSAGDDADVGLGRVRLLRWDGEAVTAETFNDGTNQPHAAFVNPLAANAEDWPMTHAVGTIPVNAIFLIGFIVVFAALVGPFNLFVFANSARRHRLFWTTPLISVAASLLLMCFIFVKDGFGGSGQRVLLCLVLPDQKKTVVIQEQVARTGVVVSHQFEVAEDLLLTPLHVVEGPARSYSQTGRRYTGDWFGSRSVQAQRADAVVPSRAEIILTNADAARDGAPPVLTSSVPAAIRKITYLDPAGRRWIGDALRTGERITLRAGEPEAGAFAPGGSVVLDAEAARLLERRGSFVAVAEDGPFFETLPSVRWTNQRAVFAGAVSRAR